MIDNSGAMGDTLYLVPALNLLRKQFDQIYMSGQGYCQSALENTGLVDEFIVKPKEYSKWNPDYRKQWLLYQARDIDFDQYVSVHGVVPGRLMFMPHDPKFSMPTACKRALNKGKNYFDEMTLRFQEKLEIGLSSAIGKRPITKHTHKEHSWLRDFRYAHGIPRDAFLLGYQFAGSSRHKWWPYFQQAIQESIMQNYPEVYLVALGDLDGVMEWDERNHHGRYINLKKSASFRQAYILTSIMDLLVSPETGVYVGAQAYPKVPKILLASHTDGTHITCGNESTIITPTVDCAPCYNLVHTCELDRESNAPLCIASIKPEPVIEAIEEVIERKRRVDVLKAVPLVTMGELRAVAAGGGFKRWV